MKKVKELRKKKEITTTERAGGSILLTQTYVLSRNS